MGLIKTKDALVRFVVINFLVIDFYGGGREHLASAAVHHQERSISSSNREDIITTNDIDALLHQLKSELARGVFSNCLKNILNPLHGKQPK